MPQTSIPRLCLLTTPETSPSVLYGLLDVLASAGSVYPEMLEGKSGHQVFDVKIVAASKTPFRCFGNVLVEPSLEIDEVENTEVVVVCDMYQPIETSPLDRYPREIAWLKRIHERGAFVASVCTGSLLLAAAGLLDGLEAATHWGYRDVFRDYYPKVKMCEDAILCLSGESHRVVTAGGTTSWQELSLYLIARFGGIKQAMLTKKVFLFGDRSDGQLPFSLMLPHPKSTDSAIADSQTWIAENYACTNPVAQMASHASLTPRTFARRFRSATGYDPMDYVQSLRIDEAKQLLETDELSVEEIGLAVGYQDPTSFRRLFKRKAGLTPAVYRRKFAKIIPKAPTPAQVGRIRHRVPNLAPSSAGAGPVE
jgi:transcriptional regulator GlxA family with amidase domain